VSDPSNASASGESSSASDGSTADYTPPKLSEGLTAPLKHPREWLFLVENRLLVAGGFLAVLLVLFFAVEMASSFSDQGLMPLFYVFGALIGGNFTLITIVISISQFVLARHLESPGEIREKMDEMVQYRREVGATTGRRVVPVAPAEFVRLLFRTIARRVEALSAELTSASATEKTAVDDEVGAELNALVRGLGEHVEYVIALLNHPSTGLNYALFATLNASYEQDIYDAWRLRTEHPRSLPDPVVDALDDLVEGLEQIDVARRVFKTVFIQSELAALSRILLYIGIPVQVATVVLLLLFTGPDGWVFSPAALRFVIPTIVTVGFAPILLLAAYILRLATVARRTASMYPFTNQADG
jgi:hypothetical protein